MSLSSPIQLGDNDAVRWCKAQRFVRLMADNAGISYTMSGFLTDINLNDNIATRWAKFGAWMELVATNISGGGGGGVTQLVAGSGVSLSPVGGTGVVTVSAAAGGGTNSYAAVTNNAGNTTVTPTVPNYDVGLNVTGSARTSIIILDTAGRGAGDTIKLVITLPATVGIVLEVRNASAVGTLLLPAEIFASQQYDTDGVDLSATWEFVYTGTAWKYVQSHIPA